MVSANGAVINDNIPSPQSYRVPLLNLKTLFAICTTFSSARLGLANNLLYWSSRRSVHHINVCHIDGVGLCEDEVVFVGGVAGSLRDIGSETDSDFII